MKQETILICGAGPSGLVLALWLTRAGIPVRIIDKTAAPGTTSRATVFHARNLEFYRQLGIDKIVLERSVPFTAANIWVQGKQRGRARFGDAATDISPYPYALIFPQDLHEQMLTEQLQKLGVEIERSTELLSFEQKDGGVQYRLRSKDGNESTGSSNYLAGCDGAHSLIRKQLGIPFKGEMYENLFYVADLQISGPIANGEMHIALDDADFLAVFPMKGDGRARLIGSVKPGTSSRQDLKWEDVSESILNRLEIAVQEVRWFSTYRVHHRVADRFQQGNTFLVGDAGHLHSPVGGQGMNTGIGDAINLAWKIAAVEKGRNEKTLLDSYSAERVPNAESLVATTDKVFSFIDQRGPLARFVRTRIAPVIIPIATRLRWFRRNLYLLISQIRVNYRKAHPGLKMLGKIQPGDRLPWVREGESDNFAPLSSMDWQMHVYGAAPSGLSEYCSEKSYSLFVFPWNASAQKAGLSRNTAYLIRPDGYVGTAPVFEKK